MFSIFGFAMLGLMLISICGIVLHFESKQRIDWFKKYFAKETKIIAGLESDCKMYLWMFIIPQTIVVISIAIDLWMSSMK